MSASVAPAPQAAPSGSELLLRFITFHHVASTPDGSPVYGVADIVDPLPKYRRKLFRSARLSAGPRGYVLVGRVDRDWATFRRINGEDCLERHDEEPIGADDPEERYPDGEFDG